MSRQYFLVQSDFRIYQDLSDNSFFVATLFNPEKRLFDGSLTRAVSPLNTKEVQDYYFRNVLPRPTFNPETDAVFTSRERNAGRVLRAGEDYLGFRFGEMDALHIQSDYIKNHCKEITEELYFTIDDVKYHLFVDNRVLKIEMLITPTNGDDSYWGVSYIDSPVNLFRSKGASLGIYFGGEYRILGE